MEQQALNRYQIRRELGRGGTGVVYEAFDAKDRTLVALKTIESAGEHLYRLKHEFRALADVQHPNLVRFGELSCGEDGTWFFTMELVDGPDFVSYVRGPEREGERSSGTISQQIADSTPTLEVSRVQSSSGPLSSSRPGRSTADRRPSTPGTRVREHRLREALGQLVAGLSAIHDAGHVHRDVKPSNVLVTREGRVVILDFGLVSAATTPDAPEAEEDPWLVGTPAYMSPEQVTGGAIGPAADWYAAGVMLFAALTGVLPFDGRSSDVLKEKLERKAPSPLDLVPGLPLDLAELTVDLLRIDPNARPTVDEIRARIVGRAYTSSSTHRVAEGVGPPFVGRVEDLARLDRALTRVRVEGASRQVVVEGEPGIGKSALVRRFLRGRGKSLLLSGRCYEQEDVPFKGIDSVVDALSEHLVTLGHEDVARVIAEGVRYLTAVFPVLMRVPAIEEASAFRRPVGNPAAVREQALRELEEIVDALARTSTVVIFVDDLQWADRDSVDVIRRLVRPARPASVLFVATMRTGAEVSPEIAAFAAEAERIALRGLSPVESRALLAAIAEGHPGRGEEATDGLIREADGHPLFLAELARSAEARAGAPSGMVALEDVLWARIQARDAIDRRFLEMVAVGGAPIAYGVIASAAEVDAGEAQKRLGTLRAAQLVRVSRRAGQRTVEPYHDRVRESVLHHLSAAPEGALAIARMHGQLARALVESTPQSSLAESVFAIVQHFNAARAILTERPEQVRVAALNLLAAREAFRATAYERACSYARAGLAFLGDEGWRDAYALTRDLHVVTMWAESFAGDAAPVADRAFQAARARVTTEADRTALHFERISILTMRRQLARAIEAGRERLAELGVTLPSTVTLDMLRAQREEIRRVQAGRGAAMILELPHIDSAVHEGAIRTLVALVPVAFFIDALLRGWLHMSAVLLSLEHGLCDAASYSLSGYGTLLRGLFEEHAEAADIGRAALALEQRLPEPKFLARLVFHYGGWHAPWIGPLADAKSMLRRACDLARECGDTTHETYSSTVLSVLTFCESATLAGVQETARWAIDVSLRRRDYDMAWVPEAHDRHAAALRGQTDRATDLGLPGSSDEDFRSWLGPSTPTALFYYRFCNADLAYLAGDLPRARALLEEAASGDQVIFGLPTTLELCLLECLVAARLTDGTAPAANAERVAWIEPRVRRLRAWAESCPMNFEPQHLLGEAELLRVRGGSDVEIAAAYERAGASARAHGAPKLEAIALERGAHHARACGHEGRAGDLTAQAADAYERWGAVTKARALRAKG